MLHMAGCSFAAPSLDWDVLDARTRNGGFVTPDERWRLSVRELLVEQGDDHGHLNWGSTGQ